MRVETYDGKGNLISMEEVEEPGGSLPDEPSNSDWRVALILWGRFPEVEAKVIQARDSGSAQGLIVWQRWEYANNVYRAELMQLRDAFGFSQAEVDESLWRADRVRQGDLSGVWPLPA